MKNKEVADMLDHIAELLEIQNVQWKPRAYRAAALNIRSLAEPIEEYYQQGTLDEIPGVGENIAEKIKEYLATGNLIYLEKLKKQIPEAVEQLLQIPGLGPKKAKLLYDKLKFKTLKELEKAIAQGKLVTVKGMGEKTAKQISEGIKKLKNPPPKRHLLGETLFLAREIQHRLEQAHGVETVDIAGSLRRMKETIGDIDFLVISQNPKEATHYFTTMPEIKQVLWTGPTKSSVMLRNGLQIDLRILDKQHYGSALQYFIGSKEHSVKLRKIAIKKGYKLSEYGLFKGKKVVASEREEEIYHKLGVQYMPPELREDRGEIEAGLKHQLPVLVELGDIKGDLHLHTTWSDGNNSIEEMAQAAQKKNYSYMAISDHSEGLAIAHGLDQKRLFKQIHEIEMLQKKFSDIHIFKSAEIDIKKDGSLDIKPEMLKKLDFITASVHSSFSMNEQEMTQRVLKALAEPKVKILGHPTGRLLLQREPIAIDLDKIFQFAKDHGIAAEINSHTERLDLNDVNARRAKEMGVPIAINTDAHIVGHLRHMELGVGVARRAWLEKKNVVNAWSLKQVEKFLY